MVPRSKGQRKEGDPGTPGEAVRYKHCLDLVSTLAGSRSEAQAIFNADFWREIAAISHDIQLQFKYA